MSGECDICGRMGCVEENHRGKPSDYLPPIMESETWEEHMDRVQSWLLSQPDRPEVVELRRLRAENETLHHEISYYESLATNEAADDWPHRDGRCRDWLIRRLRELDECRRLLREIVIGWENNPHDASGDKRLRLVPIMETFIEAARAAGGDGE